MRADESEKLIKSIATLYEGTVPDLINLNIANPQWFTFTAPFLVYTALEMKLEEKALELITHLKAAGQISAETKQKFLEAAKVTECNKVAHYLGLIDSDSNSQRMKTPSSRMSKFFLQDQVLKDTESNPNSLTHSL